MTEKEWLEGNVPDPLLEFIQSKLSGRKMRLLAVAFCRRILHVLSDPICETAIEVAERFADGQATETERRAAFSALINYDDDARRDYPAFGIAIPSPVRLACAIAVKCGLEALWHRLEGRYVMGAWPAQDNSCRAEWVSKYCCEAAGWQAVGSRRRVRLWPFVVHSLRWNKKCYSKAFEAEGGQHTLLLRDVAGNPFHSVAVNPAWLTFSVEHLAETIYQERAFDRLPILADALMDAGCNEPHILSHLQGGGKHCRGCWAIDLLTDRQ